MATKAHNAAKRNRANYKAQGRKERNRIKKLKKHIKLLDKKLKKYAETSAKYVNIKKEIDRTKALI